MDASGNEKYICNIALNYQKEITNIEIGDDCIIFDSRLFELIKGE